MTRSRKKLPITGIGTAPSEKPFKKREHRRERVAVREALVSGSEPPHHKAFGDPWDGEKDGKKYYRDAPELMRK